MSNTTNTKENTEQNEKQKEIQLPVSLRDYFAAKAMQGISTSLTLNWNDQLAETVATKAYLIADAMLKAREQ